MYFNSKAYMEMFTNIMSEGFISIDELGNIRTYNNKAKEIFGLISNGDFDQEEGKIKDGDIVIIVTNALGVDDGNLDIKDLTILGLRGVTINREDSLIVMGAYNDYRYNPKYTFARKNQREGKLELNEKFIGLDIKSYIDFESQEISIEFDGRKYIMTYINSIGHMLIIDPASKKVKFYQSNGYTARRESVKEILNRNSFMAKGKDIKSLDVIGKNIFELHKSDLIIEEFYQVAGGKNIEYIDRFEDINGYPTICTLVGLNENGKRVGAALKVEDITEIKKVISERDQAIKRLENAKEQMMEDEMLKIAFPNFVGISPQIENVKRLSLKASRSNSNVLILGDSGTGKSILAKSIHENSRLKDKPFIHVNCGSIPDSLLESELFGYEKGAFTGANIEGKKGFFELANGGTIFLDEIGDISKSLQVKLLQVIQDKSFYPVGGIKKRVVDVRIITATNKNLEDEMIKGRFREDLYYRINVFPIWIPALRERKQDIEPLIDYLLPKICNEVGSKQKNISDEARKLIMKYNWPGNIRELENILERAVNLTEGSIILPSHIILYGNNPKEKNYGVRSLRDSLEEREKQILENTLILYKGNKKKAMEVLDVSKTTFYDKLKKYDI